MPGNMGPKENWIWENIHALYTNLNNVLQLKYSWNYFFLMPPSYLI